MKLLDAVHEIIRLGTASSAYWERELPKRHPSYPVVRDGEDSGPPPPEDVQIRALLQKLPEDQVYALILLMYVGRGDFTADHLLAAYQAMKEGFPNKGSAINQMMENKTLAEYLEDGLRELERHHIDLNDPNFAGILALS